MGASASAVAARTPLFDLMAGTEQPPQMIVLGCMGSGKTTFCRQLIKYSRSGYPVLNYYRYTVQNHLLEIWKSLERFCINENIDYSRCKNDFAVITENKHREGLKDNMITAMRNISRSGLLNECQLRRRILPIGYNYEYFMEHEDRILNRDFVPTETDMVMSYAATVGRSTYTIRMNQEKYKMLELPGHHTYRRKWSIYFKAVTVLIFLVDLSEVCMEEFYSGHLRGKTFGVFKELITHPAFVETGIILLFNKRDVFDHMAAGFNFSRLGREIRNANDALNFYQAKFISLLPKDRGHFHTVSLATNNNIGHTVVDSLTKILKNNKENAGPQAEKIMED